MRRYVIERQYLVPVYEHILVKAPNFEAACRRALDDVDEPWGDSTETDYEGARPTIIVRAVEVPPIMDVDLNSLSHLLYTAGLEPVDIPDEFGHGEAGTSRVVGFV